MKNTFSKQNFEQERAMNFFKVATKIFSFLYCSFLKLKQLLAIMKMFQRSILQKNTILLEVIQSKQNLAQLSFTSSYLTNYRIKIFQKRMKVYLWNNFPVLIFLFVQAANVFCMSSHWFVFTTRTPESISKTTSVFFWIWWFFSRAVSFHGLFWNTGFVHVRLQLC